MEGAHVELVLIVSLAQSRAAHLRCWGRILIGRSVTLQRLVGAPGGRRFPDLGMHVSKESYPLLFESIL